MLNFKKKSAFTLAELLITLMIVGIVAVLVLPSLISNVNNKAFITHVKNFTTTVQQLATDQLVAHRTNNLANTDFSEPEKLMSAANFTVTKTCTAANAASDCWQVSSASYRSINNGVSYEAGLPSMKSDKDGVTAILKNGATVKYIKVDNDKAYGYFAVDVNGTDGPNIVGRDVFGFYISKKGQILDIEAVTPLSDDDSGSSDAEIGSEIQANCLNGASGVDFPEAWCYSLLVRENWKMPY